VAPQALIDAVLPLVNLQARKLGVIVETRVPTGCPRAVRPHDGRAGAAEPGAQRHAGDGQAGVRQRSLLLQVRARRAGDGRRGRKRWLEFSVADVWARHPGGREASSCSRPSSPPRPKAWAWA
jgi:two-component system sensor histidine kinase DctS